VAAWTSTRFAPAFRRRCPPITAMRGNSCYSI
jgi:hypothetical protein